MMKMRMDQQKEDKAVADFQREQFLMNMKNKRNEEKSRAEKERAELRARVRQSRCTAPTRGGRPHRAVASCATPRAHSL